MNPEIVIPVLMSCALLWWISRGMSWTRRLTIAVVTLAIVAALLVAEHAMK